MDKFCGSKYWVFTCVICNVFFGLGQRFKVYNWKTVWVWFLKFYQFTKEKGKFCLVSWVKLKWLFSYKRSIISPNYSNISYKILKKFFTLLLFIFQDLNKTWYSETPDFTYCFQETVLIWLPCVVFIILLIYEIYKIKESRMVQLPWTLLNITKFVSFKIKLLKLNFKQLILI